MRRYTILHTIEGGGAGGAETVFLALAAMTNRDRYRSVAFLPAGKWLPAQLERHGIPHIVCASKAWYTLIAEMRKVVMREKVDLIHSHLDDQNFYSSVVGSITGCKTIVTYHGAPRIAVQQGLRRRIKAWVPNRLSSEIVVVSEYLRDQLGGYGFSPQRIRRIYNGVDLGRFMKQAGANLRGQLGLGATARLVGTVANLRGSKGYEYFVESARAVIDAVPDGYFVAIGETQAEILPRLRGLISKLRLEGRIFFLGFRDNVPQLLNDLDVFVLASTDEGLSISTIEAMASARPVVVTASGGPQEIVRDGENGLLVPARDAAALAAGIIKVLQNPERARQLGESARKDVVERFSLARMISEYEALYMHCLEGA